MRRYVANEVLGGVVSIGSGVSIAGLSATRDCVAHSPPLDMQRAAQSDCDTMATHNGPSLDATHLRAQSGVHTRNGAKSPGNTCVHVLL